MASPVPSEMLQVAQLLQASLSSSAKERNVATEALQSLYGQPGHLKNLLMLAAHGDVPDHIRLSAAVALKNGLRTERQQGEPNNERDSGLEGDRVVVRTGLLEAMARVGRDGTLLGVLGECLRLIVMDDWPRPWEELGGVVMALIRSRDVREVRAGLTASRIVTKCHEYKSRDPKRIQKTKEGKLLDEGPYPRFALEKFCEGVYPIVLRFIQSALESFGQGVGGEEEWSLIRLGVKTFWSGMQYAIPPCLAQGTMAAEWFDVLLRILTWRVQRMDVLSEDDLVRFQCWKVKKWVCHIFLRFSQRYSDAGSTPKGENHAAFVADVYAKHYAVKATQAMLTVLSWHASGDQLSPRVANLVLGFLDNAVEIAALWNVMRPHSDSLLTSGLFPYLCFDSDDQNLWESDPAEFVRRAEDIMQDFYSPRAAASNLLHSLSRMRSRNTVIPFFSHVISSVLNPYANAPPNSSARLELARKKWGVFVVLSAIKEKRIAKKELMLEFLSVLERHVLVDVQSEFPFLRAKAVWLLGVVASAGWDVFFEKLGSPALSAALTLLRDREIVVRSTAAIALRYLMDEQAAAVLIRPNVPGLLEVLLSLMDILTDCSSVVPTLDNLFTRFTDDSMPMAEQVIKRLVELFLRVFESLSSDEESDDVQFSATQMLQLMQSIFSEAGEWKNVSSAARPALISSLTEQLKPVLNIMFSDEKSQFFIEELLDLYGSALYHYGRLHKSEPLFLRELLPRMIKFFESSGIDYLENMVPVFDNFLSYDLAHLASTPGALESFAAVCEKGWSPKMDDSDSQEACKIGECLILNLAEAKRRQGAPVIAVADKIVARIVSSALARIGPAEDETLRVRLFCNVMHGLFYDPRIVVRAISSSTLLQLVQEMVGRLDKLTRVHDKKSTITGLSSLITAGDLGISEAYPGILRAILALQKMISEQRESKAKDQSKLLASNALRMNGNGVRGGAGDGDNDSDLADDEDLDRSKGLSLDEQLLLDTELKSVGLSFLQAEGEAAVDGIFVALEEDEGDFDSPLDDIDEVGYMLDCVGAVVETDWWKVVGREERMALQQFANARQSDLCKLDAVG